MSRTIQISINTCYNKIYKSRYFAYLTFKLSVVLIFVHLRNVNVLVQIYVTSLNIMSDADIVMVVQPISLS